MVSSFLLMFRSRNRGSFGFKARSTMRIMRTRLGFDLVIEVLLVSIELFPTDAQEMDEFRSRNRGSFGFNWNALFLKLFTRIGFDLVIEVLLVLSPHLSTGF